MKIDDGKIGQAFELAQNSLRACYLDGKIIASPMRFSDFWARDSFFAVGGCLEIGDFEVVRETLKFFLDNQKSDGKIARKFVRDFNGLKYLFKKSIWRKKPRAIYASLIRPFNTMDSNSLCLIAFGKYLNKTGDLEFAQHYYEKLKKSLEWYNPKKKDGLIREYFLSNWMDTVFKSGRVLYTNVLYAESLKVISEIAKRLGQDQDSQEYEKIFKKTSLKIEESFWSGNYFDDILGGRKVFDSAGNALICALQITSADKCLKVLEHFEKIRKGILIPTVSPRHSFWKINPLAIFLGLGEYHNGKCWLWIDLLLALGWQRIGRKKEAQAILQRISSNLLKNGAIHEVYHENGQPYEPKFWKSAKPFAWNSGIFLEVCREILAEGENLEV